MSSRRDIGRIIAGFSIWIIILGSVYSFLSTIYRISQSDNPTLGEYIGETSPYLFAICILLLPYSLMSFGAWYFRNKANNARCQHGIRAGATKGRCPECTAEQIRFAVEQKQARAEYARKTELEGAANELHRREIERLSKIVVPSLGQLRALTPFQFETLVASMFRRLGYEVTQTPASNDRGRDGIIRKDGTTLLFECKRYKEDGSSGRPDLQKFHSAIVTDNAAGGYFITTGTFSREALEFANHLKERKITLVGPPLLLRMLHESAVNHSAPQTYQTLCKFCGEPVVHDLKSPSPVACPNRHWIEPSITSAQILSHLAAQGPTVRKRWRRSRPWR